MAKHSLYPGFVRLHYTTNGHAHVMVQPVIPTPSGASWQLGLVAGGEVDPWTNGIDDFVTVLFPLLKTTDHIDSADLYTMATADATPLFRETYSIGVDGTSASANLPFGQLVFVYRSSVGNTYRNYIMEPPTANDERGGLGDLSGDTLTYAGFFLSGASYVFSRDGGRPLAMTHFTSKINDKLRKKFLLV